MIFVFKDKDSQKTDKYGEDNISHPQNKFYSDGFTLIVLATVSYFPLKLVISTVLKVKQNPFFIFPGSVVSTRPSR